MMYLLYDREISNLSQKAEEIVSLQRKWRAWLESTNGKSILVKETPEALARYLLTITYPNPRWYMKGDEERLISQIKKDLSDMEWYNNLN